MGQAEGRILRRTSSALTPRARAAHAAGVHPGLYLETLLTMLLASAGGATVMCSLAALVKPWRELWRAWLILTAAFAVVGAFAALPVLFSGDPLPATCYRASGAAC